MHCANPAQGVLLRMGLQEAEERRSLFHLALAEFIIKVRQGQFVLTGMAKICTYVTEIAKRLWLETSRKTRTVIQNTPDDEAPAPNDQIDHLLEALQKLSAPDREILVAFYLYETPLKAYAIKNGLSHDAAKRRISRARERLKALIQPDIP